MEIYKSTVMGFCYGVRRALKIAEKAADSGIKAVTFGPIIHNPQVVYYGGTIAAPVIRDIFSNILPYLGMEKEVVEDTAETTAVE